MSATNKPARRGFLALLSGAVAAPAAMAVPAIAAGTAPAKPVIAEAPELLALGERLDVAIDAFRVAVAMEVEARALFERTKPALPPDLIAGPVDQRDQLTEQLLDTDCNLIRGEAGKPLEVFRSRRVRAHLILQEIDGRTKDGRRLHRLARLAAKYEKEEAAALEASGLIRIEHETCTTAHVVMKVARELAKLDPSTVEGAAIFARLVMVYDEASKHAGHHCADTLTGKISRRLAGALLRLDGGAQ